ncbi:MAG: haloacid dehalogenase type II [Betaproteobacteria bacterium]
MKSHPTTLGNNIAGVLFDVQGTLVDFYSTLLREGQRISDAKGVEADWAKLIDDWRVLYRQGLDAVISGTRPWVTTDVIYREALDVLLGNTPWGEQLDAVERDELNRVWRRLDPWPDTLPGLIRLRQRFVVSTLSNGSMASVISIVKNGKLPFDCLLTSELVRSFKPDPKVYQLAASSLGLPAEKILMVACHKYDLKAAKSLGFKTAFIERPLEFGPAFTVDLAPEPYFDLVADSVTDLADQLSA